MISLISEVEAGKATYIEDYHKVAEVVSLKAASGDIVVVFGAGNSYQFTKLIVERLKAMK
jgi:UDP-N-acetylmuramate--alanine ligase